MRIRLSFCCPNPQKLGKYEWNEQDYPEILALIAQIVLLLSTQSGMKFYVFDEPQAIYNNEYLDLGDDRFSQGREYATSGVLTETSTKIIYKISTRF